LIKHGQNLQEKKESHMNKLKIIRILFLALVLSLCLANGAGLAAQPGQTWVAHNVYFSLNDGSDAAQEKLIAACKKYLSGHPGTVFFAAGRLAKEFDRPVNDRDFHVSLHLVFANKEAHDQYQKHERHLKFIEENTANWKKVRVFDSSVEK
jgi:hypothetical protein